MEIHGTYADAFQPVRDRFEQNFLDGLEAGASVAVTVDGAPVVDLWAGEAGPDGAPWQRDTIANVWSSTKTMAAVCMLMLADRGLLDFDAPVADYWPEFAQNGKQGVLVRHVMSHSAGLSGFDPPTRLADLYDRRGVAASLARQAPWWEPGTASGYHAITQGQLQGEILERITGVSLGTFFRREVAEPLGADFHIGLDAAHDGRVAELVPPAPDPACGGHRPQLHRRPHHGQLPPGRHRDPHSRLARRRDPGRWRDGQRPLHRPRPLGAGLRRRVSTACA